MKDYDIRNNKDLIVNNQITKKIAELFKEQGIKSKLAKTAMLETRLENKIYSSNNNYFAEIILLGDAQIIVQGVIIQHIEFVERFTVEHYPSIVSKELCNDKAIAFLEMQEQLHALYEEGKTHG